MSEAERVYDRAIPSRFGTVTDRKLHEHSYYIEWDDGEKEWIDYDQLGRIPPGAEKEA